VWIKILLIEILGMRSRKSPKKMKKMNFIENSDDANAA